MQTVRGAPIFRLNNSDGNIIVLNRKTREIHELTVREYQLISGCGGFALPVDHAIKFSIDSILCNFHSAAARFLSRTSVITLSQILEFCLKKIERSTWEQFKPVRDAINDINRLTVLGLFLRDSSYVNPRKSTTRENIVTRIGIPTRNRPVELLRCVVSISDSLREYGRSARIVIVDTSSPAYQHENISQLTKLSHLQSLEIEYIGHLEVSTFIERMVAEGNDRSVLEYAVRGLSPTFTSHGASRNLLLFANHGNYVFHCDDDTVWRGGLQAGPHAICFTHDTAIHTELFHSRSNLLDVAASAPIDVLGQHQIFLGKKLGDILASSRLSLNSACDDAIVAATCHSHSARIGFTYNGFAGDCGMYSGTPLFIGPEIDLRSALIADDRLYHLANNSREMIRSFGHISVIHGIRGSAMMFGQDCTQKTIPYFPDFRNEDGIMGLICSQCDTKLYSACLPFYLQHLPLHERIYSPDWISSCTRLRMSDIVCSLCSFLLPRPGTLSSSSLGRALSDIASQPLFTFKGIVQDAIFAEAAKQLSETVALLDTLTNKHSALRMGLQQRSELLSHELRDREYRCPIDIPKSTGDPYQFIRNAIKHFGLLLSHWDALVEASNRMTIQHGCLGRILNTRSGSSVS